MARDVVTLAVVGGLMYGAYRAIGGTWDSVRQLGAAAAKTAGATANTVADVVSSKTAGSSSDQVPRESAAAAAQRDKDTAWLLSKGWTKGPDGKMYAPGFAPKAPLVAEGPK